MHGRVLTAQCARALAALHALDLEHTEGLRGLPDHDSLQDPLSFLDAMGDTRPAIEYGARWLAQNRPPAARRVPVHGDFRLGNLMVGPDGLRAVLDWELAHVGDAAEDLAWLSAPAWRFGGPGQVGGFGDVTELLDVYTASGGEAIDPERFRWWMVYATVKWATICAMQGSAHLSGTTRSVELAAIGRRVCESEWDLFVLLGLAPDPPLRPVPPDAPPPTLSPAPPRAPSPFGRPSAAELVEAVREYLEQERARECCGPERRGWRALHRSCGPQCVVDGRTRNCSGAPSLVHAHQLRLEAFGFADDRSLAAAIRSGACDAEWTAVGQALAGAARDQLLVANPSYLRTVEYPTTEQGRVGPDR